MYNCIKSLVQAAPAHHFPGHGDTGNDVTSSSQPVASLVTWLPEDFTVEAIECISERGGSKGHTVDWS